MTRSRLRRAALLRLVAVAGILTVSGVAPHAAAGEPGATPFVQVRIDQVTPQVATTTSEPVVTVKGTVTNIGDRPVREVMVRLEHAAAVTASIGLRTNLDGDTDQYEAAEDFVTVAPELKRGQKIGFSLSAPMRSAAKHSLDISAPGVYPMLVNVNGTPTTVHRRGWTTPASCCPWLGCRPIRRAWPVTRWPSSHPTPPNRCR